MSELPSESARGWLHTLLAIVERGGPVTLLITLVLGGSSIYWLVTETRRLNGDLAAMTAKCDQEEDALLDRCILDYKDLLQQLKAEQAAHLALALDCGAPQLRTPPYTPRVWQPPAAAGEGR